MKRILILLMATVISLPQVCIADDAENLMGLGIPGPAAEYIAEDMANLQVTDITTSDDVIVGDDITFSDASAADTRVISGSTADADDDLTLCLAPGGACADTSRSAYINAKGNEASGGPDLDIYAGAASGGNLSIGTSFAGQVVSFVGGASGTDLTIADNLVTVASGTSLTMTSGTFTITSGDAVLTSGDLTFTSGAINVAAGTNLGIIDENGANTACDTTCTAGCILGIDTGTGNIVDCADATADTCACAGAAS